MTDESRMQGSVALDDWGVIRARGDDAVSFLQGQLTNDVAGLDVRRAALAGYCSPKGRLLATFVMWKDAQHGVLLACSRDLLAATLKRLSMYVLRAKCKLDDASAEIPLRGVAGPLAGATDMPSSPWHLASSGGRTVIRLPDAPGTPRLLVAGGDADEDRSGLTPDAWRWLEVQSGLPRIQAATVDQFVPQMVNLEVVGGVDFHKGCYPGQEIVARSQYRGTLKRRMALFDGASPLAAGQDVFDRNDPSQPAGMVVIAAPGPREGHSALVEVKLSALEGGDLRAGSADGPALVHRPLPYSLPAPATA